MTTDPSSDVLERLRCPTLHGGMSPGAMLHVQAMADTMEEAADTIERLSAALHDIAEELKYSVLFENIRLRNIALAALSDTKAG